MASITALGVGSGLDLTGLLDQLQEAERGKLDPIERQMETQKTKISAFGQLQSALSSFQDAAKTLNDPSLFQSLSTNVKGEAVTATANGEALPGSYNVSVEQLATAGTLATRAVESESEPLVAEATQLTLRFAGDAEDFEGLKIDIAADSSLDDIRDAINATADSGVSASIIFDGEGYRLALSSTQTGAEASVSAIEFGDVLTADVIEAGQDAKLSVNGVAITSANNAVEGAIQGVTLNLQETGDTRVAVEQNTRAVREAITDFVDAYNDLKTTMGELTSFNAETGVAGELNGDGTVRSVESQLRRVLSGGVEGEFSLLSDIGITLQRDGSLSIDEDELDAAIVGQQDALSAFFAGSTKEGGLAGQLNATVDQLLGSNGAVKGAISGAEGRIESLTERHARMEKSIEQTIARYRTQFAQLDGMVAQMNQTSEYLTQQFDALDAQLGRK